MGKMVVSMERGRVRVNGVRINIVNKGGRKEKLLGGEEGRIV